MRMSWKTCGLVLAGLLSGAAVVEAEGFLEKHWNALKRDTVRNNAWPEPFIPADRAHVRAPFQQCIMNGYRFDNTLSDYYFDPDTGVLKDAGADKIYSILTERPPQFRTIFVLQADSEEQTAARVTSVQQLADTLCGDGELAQVMTTCVRPRTAPAYYIDAVDRAYQASQPIPRVPARSGSSGGSSSGGASSGGMGSGS